MTFAELIDSVRRAGGIDATIGEVGGWINERYKRQCVRSNWSKEPVVIAQTVASQSRYPLEARITEVHELRIGSTPYKRTGTQSLWDLQGTNTYIDRRSTGGVFAPYGQDTIEVYPIPDESGIDIEALCTVVPLELQGQMEPITPSDYHRSLVDGAMADGLLLLDENLQAAQFYEDRWDKATEELRRRGNRRLGGGPHQIPIQGIHYS